MLGDALFRAAVATNAATAALTFSLSITKAWAQRKNFFSALNESLLLDGAFAFLGATFANDLEVIKGVNQMLPVLTPIISAAFIGGLVLTANSLINIRQAACDGQTGGWYGSDLCK